MRRTTLILTAALVLAACGGADGGGAGDDTTTTTPLAEPTEAYPLLTIEDVGGFVPVQYNLKRIPRYVLMSDGTIYMQAPITEQFPGPAMIPVQVGTIDDATLAGIQTAIEAAGLDTVDDETNDAAAAMVADASTTVFTYVDADGTEHRYGVYALGMPEVDFGDAPVEELTALLGSMDEAAVSASDASVWTPTAVEVFVSAEGLGYDAQFANTQDYPLDLSFSELTGQSESAGFRCLTLEGDEAAALVETMGEANEATTFVDGDGNEYSLIARPLLPGQESC